MEVPVGMNDALREIALKSGLEARPLFGRQLTTVAVGGPLTLMEPKSIDSLKNVIRAARSVGVRYRVLGAGSNLLIPDEGVGDLVIRLGRDLSQWEIQGTRVRAGGGASLMRLSRATAAEGLSGFEFAGGIPATVGGAIVMNAGAHGGEIVDVLRSIKLITPDGEALVVTPHELSFGYRKSGIPAGSVVVEGEFDLRSSVRAEVERRRSEYLAERKKRQPLQSPSFGSVFRNPEAETSAGKLLELAGMKGVSVGGARVSPLHANWIVNEERSATATDVTRLISECQAAVQRTSQILLVPEVVRW